MKRREDLLKIIDDTTPSDSWDRQHLGPSDMATECDRAVWLRYRKAGRAMFETRIRRLFERGKNEEPQIIAMLQRAGIEIADTQAKIQHMGGHISGHIDATDADGHPWEFKTHSLKSFEKVIKNGPPAEHIQQVNFYAASLGVDAWFYVAVCKNDDRVEVWEGKTDRALFERTLRRMEYIISEIFPPPVTTSWLCRFCDMQEPCAGEKPFDKHCRTCRHVQPPTDNSDWFCWKNAKGEPLTPEAQRKACDKWRQIK